MEGILIRNNDCENNRWTVRLDGKELSVVRKHLSMDEKEKDRTIMSAARLLGNCSDPHGEPQHKVGLAIGKVQSGKTSNYIVLTALAFDNDYDIVIIFGGISNVLLKQTYERVINNFDIEKRVDERRLIVLSTSNDFNNYSPSDIENLHRSGRKIIITVLKSYYHIQKIINMLKKSNLSNKPTLIIDDEGDQASLNGAVKKNKTTTTYREFVNLFNDLTFSTFISVTATPQANLLIDISDTLSPDFCELIKPGDLYSGADTFHYAPKTKYISIIPDNENIMLDELDGIPASFLTALSTFFVGGVIRKLRGDNSVHSMLIHPSSKIIDHKQVASKLSAVLDQYRGYCDSPEPDIFNSFREFVKLGCDELSTTVSEKFDFEEIVSILKKDFFDCKLQVLNDDSDIDVLSYDFKYTIVIGGTMVERGLTVKNLAVTYIVRTNKGRENADTVSQRARWFGYRVGKNGRSYLDLCRIFMTKAMADGFYRLKIEEDSIWENIKYGQKEGLKLKEMPIMFDLGDHFNPTRTNVVPYVEQFKFGKWKTQRSIKGMEDPEIIYAAFDKLLQNYDYEIVNYPTFDCKLYKDVDFELLYSDIIDKYYSNPDLRFDKNYMLATMHMLKIENKPIKLDVMIMRIGQNEERKIFDDLTVNNIMQGSNGIEGEANYYPGDNNIHNNRVQLQIHNVKMLDTPGKTRPLLAFYAPGTMRRLVGRING